MFALLISRLGREILRGIRDEIEDARETGEFPLIRARVEWHENKAAEWLLKAIDRKKKGYDVGSRAHRRSYRRAALAAKRNAATARLLENIIEGLSKGG